MIASKNGLDEMQREKRNSIGNQMFLVMFYALLVDAGLNGFGFSWLKYPVNTMVIITVCMGIYLARVIAANAYLPPKASSRKSIISLVIAVAFSVILMVAFVKLFGKQPAQGANDNSALILFVVSAVGLLISLVAAIIKKVNDNAESDD